MRFRRRKKQKNGTKQKFLAVVKVTDSMCQLESLVTTSIKALSIKINVENKNYFQILFC